MQATFVHRTDLNSASPTGSFTPPGYWNVVAADYAERGSLDELAATRAFALVHGAIMDALIGCWDAKYTYWTMRPSQADPNRVAEVDATVTDAGLSRMFAGIHYRSDIVAGRDLGAAVGRWALAHAGRID